MLQKGDEPVPGYRLEEFLGRGQFGEVWRATSPGRAKVALKFLNLTERQGLKEFKAIQRIKSLRHAHLASITALWLLDEKGAVLGDDILDSYTLETSTPRDTMMPTLSRSERVPQRLVVATLLCDMNLNDRMRQWQQTGQSGIPLDELLRYMEEAAKGIDFLNSAQHDLGEGPVTVQHCDIKPANIMLTGDSVMICDFGVARFLSDARAAATGTSVAGSPAYMAPECIKSKPTSRSDQYSLAITYVELRTGRLPFHSESWMEVLEAHCTGNLDLSGLSSGERAVIRKATSVKPDDRYPSCVAMVAALRLAAEQPQKKGNGGRPLLKLAALLSLAALVAGGVFAYLNRGKTTLTANNGGTAVSPGEETVSLQVIPPVAVVQVDGAPVPVDEQGRFTVQRPRQAQVEIAVTGSAEYRTFQQTFRMEDLIGQTTTLRLERDLEKLRAQAQSHANRAFQILDADAPHLPQLADAAQAYQQAIQLDGSRFAAVPPIDRELLSAGQEYSFTVHSVAIDATRPWLVTREQQSVVSLWDLDDANRPRAVLHEHADPLLNVVMRFPYVVSADLQGKTRITRLDDKGMKQSTTEPNSLQAIELAITSDLRWTVAGDYSGNVSAWPMDSAADAAPRELGRHESGVKGIVVTPDSQWAITADESGTVMKWNLKSPGERKPSNPLGSLDGDVYALVISEDGRFVVAGGAGKSGDECPVWLLDLTTDALRHLPQGHTAEVTAIVLAPAAHGPGSGSGLPGLASGSAAGDIQWRATPDSPPSMFAGRHDGAVRSLAFCPAAGWLVSGSEDGTVGLWNLDHPERRPLLLNANGGSVVQVLTTPRYIVAACSNGAVLLWELRRCILVSEACRQLDLEPQKAPSATGVIDA